MSDPTNGQNGQQEDTATTESEQTPDGTTTTEPTGQVEYNDPENADTRQHGYEWQYGIVSYKPDRSQGSKIVLGKTPYLRVTDTVRFAKYLPGVIEASLDGTSIKVRCQGVTRPMLQKNRKVSADDMKRAILNSLRGVRAPRTATVIERVVEKKVYVAIDGSEHATELEARQHSMAVMADEAIERNAQNQ